MKEHLYYLEINDKEGYKCTQLAYPQVFMSNLCDVSRKIRRSWSKIISLAINIC